MNTWTARVLASAHEDMERAAALFDPARPPVDAGEYAQLVIQMRCRLGELVRLVEQPAPAGVKPPTRQAVKRPPRRRTPLRPTPAGLDTVLTAAAEIVERPGRVGSVDVLVAFARATTGRSELPLVGAGPEPRLFRAAVVAVADAARLDYEPMRVDSAVAAWSKSVSRAVLAGTLRAAADAVSASAPAPKPGQPSGSRPQPAPQGGGA